MGILIFLLSLLFIVVTVMVMSEGDEYIPMGFMLMLIVVGAFYMIPYGLLNSDVNKIIMEKEYIELEQQYVTNVKAQIDSLPEQKSALMNADTPVASMIESLHRAEDRIRERKVNILDTKRSVMNRKSGLTSYIFWFYPDEKLDQIGDKGEL